MKDVAFVSGGKNIIVDVWKIGGIFAQLFGSKLFPFSQVL
jgi:hypothetical protein